MTKKQREMVQLFGKLAGLGFCLDEAEQLRRVAAVLAARNERHPENPLQWYHQGDPRGCALYILRQGDVPEGKPVDSYYSRGIAVC